MLQKTIDREKRKSRKTWNGYVSRATPTMQEKKRKQARKEKQNLKKYFA